MSAAQNRFKPARSEAESEGASMTAARNRFEQGRTDGEGEDESPSMSARFLRIAVLWFAACVLLGAYMGATHQYLDKQVHVHGNLLGWVSCALFALVHRAWPMLQTTRLARLHFWLHNLGLLSLVSGLMGLQRGWLGAEALLGVGSVALAVATLAFGYAVWRVTAKDAVARVAASGSARPVLLAAEARRAGMI